MNRARLLERRWFPFAANSTPARLHGLDLSPIKEVELRASRIPGVVSLAQGIPSFDTPEPIKRYAEQMIAEGACARYSVTPGLPRLREAIALVLAAEGMAYDPDTEIVVTAGSIEAIAATLLASVEPGDEVLVVSPTYASYLPAIQLAGGVPRFVALREDDNFDLDPDAIAEAANRRTRALLICNPNNPTGTVFSRAQTLRMLEVAEKHDLLVITDEVYKDFLYGDARICSAAMESAARHRVIRVFSFSKAYGMTGWRIGFVHGPAARMAEILKVHDALVTCAPVVSQYAALAALELGEQSVAAFRAEFRRRRDRVIERLDTMPEVFDYQKPNASYFVFPRIKDVVPLARDSRALASDILERARVALVPGIAFGPSGEAHLRLCYARPPEDIEQAFDRLEDYFSGRPARPRSTAQTEPPPPARSHVERAGIAVLRHFARVRLRRKRPRIVAVAGTQGKTVVKRALQDLLETQFRVRANPLSYNTEVGLPLAILGLDLDIRHLSGIARGFLRAAWSAYLDRTRLDVLVLELGTRRCGDMRSHLEIVRPDVVVVTPLAPSHSEDQGALAVLRAEIDELCTSVQNHAAVLLCADDPALAELAGRLPGAVLFRRTDLAPAGGALVLRADGEELEVKRDTVGTSSLYAVNAAVRVARLLGADAARVREFLAG